MARRSFFSFMMADTGKDPCLWQFAPFSLILMTLLPSMRRFRMRPSPMLRRWLQIGLVRNPAVLQPMPWRSRDLFGPKVRAVRSAVLSESAPSSAFGEDSRGIPKILLISVTGQLLIGWRFLPRRSQRRVLLVHQMPECSSPLNLLPLDAPANVCLRERRT